MSTHRVSEWAEIIEPRSQQRMFVNLESGECTWQLSSDTPFQPASNAQWWELYDVASRRFYYYHVASQRTVWQRPRDVPAADIVSLARIQVPQGAALPPNRSAHSHSRPHSHSHSRSRRHRHAEPHAGPAAPNTERSRELPQQEELQLGEPFFDEPELEPAENEPSGPSRSHHGHARCSSHRHHRRRERSSPKIDQLDGAPRNPAVLDEESQARRAHHRCTRHQRSVDSNAPRRSSADAVNCNKHRDRERVRSSRTRRGVARVDDAAASSSEDEQPRAAPTRKPLPRKPAPKPDECVDLHADEMRCAPPEPEVDEAVTDSESDGSIEETMQRIISDVNALQLQVGSSQPAAVSMRIAQLQQSLMTSGAAPGLNVQPGVNNDVSSGNGARRCAPAPEAKPAQQNRRPQFPRTNPSVGRTRPTCKTSGHSPSNGHNQPQPASSSPSVSSRTNSTGSAAQLLSEGDSGFSTLPQAQAASGQVNTNMQQHVVSARAQSDSPRTHAQFAPVQVAMPPGYCFAGGVLVSPSSSSSSSGDTVASGSQSSGSSTVSSGSGSFEYEPAPAQRKPTHAHSHQNAAPRQPQPQPQSQPQPTLSHSSSAGAKPHKRSKPVAADSSARNAFVQHASQNVSQSVPLQNSVGGRPMSMFMSVHPLDDATQDQSSSHLSSAQPLFQQPFALPNASSAQHGNRSALQSQQSQASQMVTQFVPINPPFAQMVAQAPAQPLSQMHFAATNANGNGLLAQFGMPPQSQQSPVGHVQRFMNVQPLNTNVNVANANVKPPSRSSSSSSGMPMTAPVPAPAPPPASGPLPASAPVPPRQPYVKQLTLDDNMGTLPISCAGMFFRKAHHPPPLPPPPAYAADCDDAGSPTPSCASPETVTANPLEQYLEENRKPSKKGLFTKQKSVSTLLSFSKEPLAKPLLVDSKDKQTRRDLIDTFRCIQQYMRDAPFAGTSSFGSGENDALLDLVCDVLIARGWQAVELRDEIYLQIGKQLSNNASLDSLLRGWELLAVALDFFAPSSRLRPFLDEFIRRHVPSAANVQAFAQFALSGELAIFAVRRFAVQAAKRLARIAKSGRRKLVQRPSYADVRQSWQALFETSMFAASLDELLELQRERGFTDRRLPWIQTALSEEILRLRGTETEGIFRVSADLDEVNRLRACVERWELPTGLSDPHVPASLLKLFYRELAEPLIPAAIYPECIEAHSDAATCVRIVEERLPPLHRLVLSYLVRFLQVFAVPENVAHTKMDVNNLAMVMAPNIMRCESDDPDTIFSNTRMEMQFLRNLIQHLDTSCVEGVI